MIVTIFTGNIGSVKPVAQVGDSKVINFNVACDKHFTAKNGEKATETTCNDYISKPINKTLLYTLIKKLVNKDKK